MLLLATPIASAATAAKQRVTPTHAEIAEKKSDLSDVRNQIETLRNEMAAAEGTRAAAVDQLKDAERDISATQRSLHLLGEQRADLQTTLRNLNAQSRELDIRLHKQQTQLGELINRQYLYGNPDALRLLLNGDDPNRVARDLYYLSLIAHARQRLLNEIDNTLQRMRTLADDTREHAAKIADVEAQQKEQQSKLLAQRARHKAALEKISTKIAMQRREISTLQRDEKQLTQLITRLTKIITTKPKARKTAPPSSGERASENTAQQAPELSNQHTPEATPSASFAKLKGKLRLPVKGIVGNRFGAMRQEGSSWKGLFIRASAGSEIKVIAGGRIVFADWMRGFGNLLIVDHGDSYLSIYGNNDALLKQVGDTVHGGDTIATVGNSGGNPESGLYFEIRYQGQALDPLSWTNTK